MSENCKKQIFQFLPNYIIEFLDGRWYILKSLYISRFSVKMRVLVPKKKLKRCPPPSIYVSESSSESNFSSILNVVLIFFFILLQVPDSDILGLLPPRFGLLPDRLDLLPSRLRLLPPILLPGKLYPNSFPSGKTENLEEKKKFSHI